MADRFEELRLIQACLDGPGDDGWEAFVRAYSRLIWHSIQKTFLHHSFPFLREDVEDVFGDLFLSLVANDYKKLRSFRDDYACSTSTWLTVMATRRAIDFIRKHGKQRASAREHDADELVLRMADAAANAEESLERRQLLWRIDEAAAGLSDEDRILFHMLLKEGKPPEETARKLGISPGAVYVRKHRLVGRIKKMIADL